MANVVVLIDRPAETGERFQLWSLMGGRMYGIVKVDTFEMLATLPVDAQPGTAAEWFTNWIARRERAARTGTVACAGCGAEFPADRAGAGPSDPVLCTSCYAEVLGE